MERISSNALGTDPQNWANNNLIIRNGLGVGGNAINGTPKTENSVSKSETQVSSLPFSEFEGLILTYLGSPYIVTNTLTIPQSKTLTVESGTTLKFSRRQGLVVNGTLLAKGKENKKITFNSLSDSSYWGQIYFTSQGQGSVLENCLVKNAGQIVGNLAIMVDSTSINIKDSKIENTTVEVLRLINSSSTIENLTIEKNTTGKAIEISGGAPEIKNSKIIGTYAGIFIEGGSRAILEGNYFEGIDYPQGVVFIDGAYPVLKNNSGALNSLNGIYLYGTVSNDWVLYKNEIPYVIDYLEVAAGKTLEIEAGTTIQIVPPSAYSGAGRMEINGTLKAIGTENNKIIFTVLTPGSRWDTIRFNSQEATSILKYVDIQYGGKSSAPTKGALSVENAKVEFQYLSFDGNYYSLYFKNSFLATISDLEFTNCFRGILFEDGCPPMNNLSLNCTCNFASPAISCSTTSESICP